jgi:hypothetical protein
MSRILKRLLFLFALCAAPLFAQQIGSTNSNPLGGNLTVQDAGTCSTSGSFLWQHLPINAATTTVNLSGTFSGTLTIRLSNNGGTSWTTNTTVTSIGTTSISTNGFTDICADVTTFTSGSFGVTITTGLNIGPQGPPGPAGSGGGSVTQVATLPATCTPGQSFQIPSGQIVFCGATANTFVADGVQAVNMMAYGVKADLRTCIGTAATFTTPSPNLACITGNFCNGTTVACPAGQTSDVGKRINATNGCCNSSPPVNGVTQALPVNTTILSVTDATHIVVSNNFTISSSGTNPYVFWATDDEAAVAAADTAYQNAPACTALLWPATAFLVRGPHFNVAPPQCEQIESGGGVGRLATANYIGWGSNNSVMYLDSAFNFAGCTFGFGGNGCFFSMLGAHAQHLGISGGWNQVPNGGAHTVALVDPGSSAEFLDLRLVGFSSGDGSTVGFSPTGGFSIYRSVYVEGFGFISCNVSGNITEFDGGYCGNSQGNSLNVNGGPSGGPIWLKNYSIGKSPTTLMNVGTSPFYSLNNYYYGTGGVTSLNLITSGIVSFDGDTIGGGTNTIAVSGSGAPEYVVVKNSHIFGGSTANVAVSNTANSHFIDAGGNFFESGSFSVGAAGTYQIAPGSNYVSMTGLVPTCPTVTGATATCVPVAGSTNEKGTLRTTVTAAGTAAGTITMNFVGTFTGSTTTTPSCTFTPALTGTGAWNARATAFLSTRSSTAPIITWDNNAAALGNLTWDIDYACTAR